MGFYGPTNDEFSTLKSEVDRFRVGVEAALKEVRAEIAHRATESEVEARGAAERASALEVEAEGSASKIIQILSEIDQYKTDLLGTLEGLKSRLNGASNQEEELRQKIDATDALYAAFLERKKGLDRDVDDLSRKIDAANEYLERSKKLPAAVEEAEDLINDLNSYGESAKNTLTNIVGRKNDVDKLYREIYGEDVGGPDNTMVHVDGLKDHLELSYVTLEKSVEELGHTTKQAVEAVANAHEILLSDRKDKYELLLKEASARYDQINTQLTGLLPGSMAEGLSAAYEKKREAEEKSLLRFEERFSYAIYGLVAISMIPFAVDLYLLAGMGRDLIQVIKETPSLIVAILPIYFPVLWLAYSTGKKANLSKRLIEEYTHKSVLGKTFSGLSNQIETLQHQGAVKEELRTKLLFNVLQVSAENPGKLITDYNKSDHPLMDALEKSGKLSDSLEALSKIPGLSALAKKISDKGATSLQLQEKRVEAGLAINEEISAKE